MNKFIKYLGDFNFLTLAIMIKRSIYIEKMETAAKEASLAAR